MTNRAQLTVELAARRLNRSRNKPRAARPSVGVVANSHPEAELAETAAKFVPVRDALGA